MESSLWSLPELTEADHAALMSVTQILEYGAGERIIQEGERPQALFALVAGEVDVSAERNGSRHHLALLGPGALIGEMSLVSGSSASATVWAVGPCRMARVTADAIAACSARQPDFAARLYRGIARVISERLRTSRVQWMETEDHGSALPSWTDTLASLRSLELPPIVETYIARYEQVAHRNGFLWRWCWRGLEETALSTVPETWRLHTLSTKLLAVILNVLLDDLADREGSEARFEEAVALLGANDALSPLPYAPTLEKGIYRDAYFDLVLDLWRVIAERTQTLPQWMRYRSLWSFDYQQVFTSMRYSLLSRLFPGMDNLSENRAYVPHNMNMMVFATIDLMVSNVDEDEVGLIREAILLAQSIGQIGNMVATWRREAPDRDFASRVFVLALDAGTLTRRELEHLSPEEIIARVEAAGIEERLLAEWREYRQRLSALVTRVHSVDLGRLAHGVDQLLAMSLAAKGMI